MVPDSVTSEVDIAFPDKSLAEAEGVHLSSAF
jgi:hypothetical protein